MIDDKPSAAGCRHCGGKRVATGSLDDRFSVNLIGTWFSFSWFKPLRALACLDCGAVTPYLRRSEVESLRRRYGYTPLDEQEDR